MVTAALESGSFRYHGQHRLVYDIYGGGDRVLILIHGLLMNRRMYDRLGPELAARGNRVVCVDLLGHGESGQPTSISYYSMTAFADQIVALLDHLGFKQAVIGGTSLGANVSLELAAHHADRARALFLEMPVLENALVAVAVAFTPIMVGAQLGAPLLRALARLVRRVPRTTYLTDIVLDWVRREPESSANVLQGLLLGRTAPTPEERRVLQHPALVVGHPRDPLHPFSDAGMLVDEMPNARLVDANSALEWRLNPERLNAELAAFLTEVWEKSTAAPRATEATG